MGTILQGLLIVIAATAIFVAGAVAVRRRFPREVFGANHEEAVAVMTTVGTLYAVLLAFTVIIVWTHYSDAKAAVEEEANHLGDLSRLSAGFDEADHARGVRHMDHGAAVTLQPGGFGLQRAERELLRIHQQPVSDQHKQRIDKDADPQRLQSAQRARLRGSMGDGHGHRCGRISEGFPAGSKHARA